MTRSYSSAFGAAACAAALLLGGCTGGGSTETASGGAGASPSAGAPSRPAPAKPPARSARPGAVGAEAFDFSLTDSEGRTVALSDFEGKVVVLDFWATWCPPCRKEIPGFVALQDKYRDQGVEVVGVTLDDSWDPVHPFMKSYGINYTIVKGDAGVVTQYGGFRGIPTTFVIDRDGIIRKRHEGYGPPELFTAAVEALL